MKCNNCGSTNTYIKDYQNEFTIKGKKITFKSKRRFCKDCNSLVYDNILDNEASEKAISLYNTQYGISKDQIISLRNKYNLSLELFSKVIGCAKKTLISYEKGTSIPNDSYMIIIKSLIAKPETIYTIINANKDQFTDKELKKINSKLELLVPNNIKNISFGIESTPNEYNGYTIFSKEKLYNMILFFADKTVLKTKLLKELFYSDFLSFKELCKSMSGLEYAKLPYGPVPDSFDSIIYDAITNGYIDYNISYNNDYESHNITSLKKFNSSLFTKEELDLLNKIKSKFKSFGSKDIADYSHNEKAYIKTKDYNKISYELALDIEIDK